ncbi:hypothetical protein M0813_03313 [Anaeramoeba flamelloides]|uniref:non-specific serine/threonine protein kinase n=1 Tax=Anaeramoeba flamelloides TaxID=1746091 RepID=A0ABQ8Y334_9EUKA|nr:hypothetical protein M0813_03313 [Anaeramoeba flamelloides]
MSSPRSKRTTKKQPFLKRRSLGSNKPKSLNYNRTKKKINDDEWIECSTQQSPYSNRKKKVKSLETVGLMGNQRVVRDGKIVVIRRSKTSDGAELQKKRNSLQPTTKKKQNFLQKTKQRALRKNKQSPRKKTGKEPDEFQFVRPNKKKVVQPKNSPKSSTKKLINSSRVVKKPLVVQKIKTRISKPKRQQKFQMKSTKCATPKTKKKHLPKKKDEEQGKEQKQRIKKNKPKQTLEKVKVKVKVNKKEKEKEKEKEQNSENFFYFSDSEEQSGSDDQENPQDYKKGGYHPAKVGEVFKKRYKAILKIGWGYFSTVWLVEDIKYGGKLVRTKTGKIVKKEKYLALKIVKSSKVFSKISVDEIKILLKVTKEDAFGNSNIVKLIDHFLHQGPNGKHICLVFEFLDQKNLLHLLEKYGENGLPINIVKEITRQTLIGLDHLHTKCGIIHTDIKPENIMLYNRVGTIPNRLKRKYIKSLKILDGENEEESENVKKKRKERPTKPQTITKLETLSQEKHIDSESNEFLNITEEGTEGTRIFETRESKTRIMKNLAKESGKKKTKKKKKQSDLFMTEKEKKITQNTPKKKRHKKTLSIEMQNTIKCKIVDLGNACWADHPFSPEIQTREYRSPEVILGLGYNHSADIWSLGCMIFELLTGEVMFSPSKGEGYSKDEDHLALIMELFGKIPNSMLLNGTNSSKLVEKNGQLKNIKNLHFWHLEKVLDEKYNFDEEIALEIADFLKPMFCYDINDRVSAKELLNHAWLKK